MALPRSGAQRASSRRIRSIPAVILVALLFATASTATAPMASAAGHKVVIVVGPVASETTKYRNDARQLASQARSYGATVLEIYSPNATWQRVQLAAKGASVVIYLGHGNGWPSPHPPFSVDSKDGFGLNATAGAGNSNTKYYGESYMAKLALAPHAVVVLNHLCYASGNNEWGAGNPVESTAIKRVDNYGAGFLRGGAKAVFVSGITSVGYVLHGLFKGPAAMTMKQLFWSDPARTVTYRLGFASVRTPGARAAMDPYAPNRYFRSVVGFLDTTIGDWR